MGEQLKKLTVGTVSRDVQHLTAGDGIEISALGVISLDADDIYTKTEVDTLLDDYYTKTEVDTELDDYYTKTETDTELDGKVDKVTGKGLSTNDYTTADKTIVSNVTTNLNNKVDKVTGKGLSTNDYTNADKAIVDAVTTDLAGKVDKVTGKGLSTNDYTTAEKTKLAGIADGAEVNVQSDWSQTNTSADDFIKNKPTIPDVSNFYTKTQVDTALGNKVDKVTGKGLSANDYTNADKAIVDAVTTNLSNKVDKVTGKGLSTNDYTNADKAIVDGVTTALAGKQNTLTAGTNISISGNTISATDTKYTAGQYISISSANEIAVNLTKANLLSILGYRETTIALTDSDGTTTTKTILVKQ